MHLGYLLAFFSTLLVSSVKGTDCDENENIQEHLNVHIIINDEDIDNTFELHLNKEIPARRLLEKRLVEKGRVLKTKVSDLSLLRRRNTDPLVYVNEYKQIPFEAVTNSIYRKYNLSENDIADTLSKRKLKGENCEKAINDCMSVQNAPQCDRSSVYRTLDGSCNNLENPNWGRTFSCQRRMLRAYYTGESGFRRSVLGGDLPEPRTLSLNVHSHLNRPTNYVTHMYMFFGQFLDHDMTLTPGSTTVDNQAIECCPPEQETHPQCAPIRIRNDDPFYSNYDVTCINFVRSSICPVCTLGQRQQMNSLTIFIDASLIYGTTLNESNSLRTNDNTGRFEVQRTSVGDLLPRSNDPQNDQCSFPDNNQICFRSGDSRVNQHTSLTSLHTVLMREHNRLADQLRIINPQWDGERIFQEARKIVGAQMQVITYKEYLPITLGADRMTFFGLWISSDGSTLYDSTIDPTALIEFTTAAFRFGHSLINSVVTRSPPAANGADRLLRNEFFEPFALYDGLISPLLRGVSRSPAQWFDRHLVPDVRNYLYRIRGESTGLDLASINIQRGRDHGLPPYTAMVYFCSDKQYSVGSFDDLYRYNLMTYDNAQLLRRNYRHVDDIDLWTGILSEIPKEGAVVGPTAACIIGLQFKKLKYGDRFYFEHRNERSSFTYR
ncbi:Peroxidasin, partial [Stegodyphus mimosarum]